MQYKRIIPEFFGRFKQPVYIACAQSTVVKAVAGPAGFAPYHAAVVGPDIAGKILFYQRENNARHIKGAAA